MSISNAYIGTIPVNDKTNAVIAFIRASLKGSGFNLSINGRNPNRKQFYGKRFTYSNGLLAKHYYAKNLPRICATSFALYLRPAAATRHDKFFTVSEKAACNNANLALRWAVKS